MRTIGLLAGLATAAAASGTYLMRRPPSGDESGSSSSGTDFEGRSASENGMFDDHTRASREQATSVRASENASAGHDGTAARNAAGRA